VTVSNQCLIVMLCLALISGMDSDQFDVKVTVETANLKVADEEETRHLEAIRAQFQVCRCS